MILIGVIRLLGFEAFGMFVLFRQPSLTAWSTAHTCRLRCWMQVLKGVVEWTVMSKRLPRREHYKVPTPPSLSSEAKSNAHRGWRASPGS